MKKILIIIIFVLTTPILVLAADHEDMNKANNPLTPMLGINLQNYYASSIYGTDKTSNNFLLRGVFPHKSGGAPQIMRVTAPYVSAPSAGEHNTQALGDMNLFDIFLLKHKSGVQYGVGPYFVFPTAKETNTGSGLWQAGASAVAMHATAERILGALFTYQHSFAGPDERPTQNLATVQPFLVYNLPHGFYARSSAVWNLNWQNGNYYIPVGAGGGKVVKLQSGTILNFLIEPQWTVFHDGDGQPQFQVFAGLNMQFPF